MIEEFTLGTFSGRVGQTFRVLPPEARPVALELIEAVGTGEESTRQARRRGQRDPFSLLFRGPLEPLLDQAQWSLEHAEMGRFELFLVPVEQDADGTLYEAVFT